ncbi:MAG: phosphoenolpyruvate--protein phosphotransferase [Alphaproteobacteria bacterium]|nr:phosphoenolpyruvate--protein phosphotransferase [Alphaproteobacteria bacterium]
MKTKGTQDGEKVLHGLGVSTGIAIGPAYIIDQKGLPVPEYCILPNQVEKEIKRFEAAIAKTQKQLSQLRAKAEALPSDANEEIGLLLEAYKGMVSSSRLIRGVETTIVEERLNAETAVQRQIALIAAGFAAMKDDYLASRADDVREVGARLIRNLLQQSYNPFADAPKDSLLMADEITPADTALMDPDRVAGFAAVLGGAEGHAAIMARALGLPAVLGVASLVSGIVTTGDIVIVDGHEGKVILRPTAETLAYYKGEASRQARETKKLKTLRDVPAMTQDGTSVKLMANLELPRDADMALDVGAVGVGLLRTEFSFMNRPDLPSEDEQFEALRDIVKRMDGKLLTVRTLDIGGEKLASALGEGLSESVNPALGLRAIRLGLAEPKLLDAQLAAILRASTYGPLRILIPMVSSVDQIRQVRDRLVQVEKKLLRRGMKLPQTLPPLGAMIEIPAAALVADALSQVCDFFAIGSNDLTQYTLAIDRGDDRVAYLYNPYHPAVIRLIEVVIAAAWRANIPISLCGELAGDPRATALLLGLGLREFSMSPARLPQVKQEIRSLTIGRSVAFAQEILRQADEVTVRRLIDAGAQSIPETVLYARKKK